MSEYFRDSQGRLFNKECGDMLELEDNSIDTILTDPPYNVGKDYGYGVAEDKKLNYKEWLDGVWVASARVVKDGGFLIFTNTTYFIPHGMNPPAPWKYLHLACWHKPLSLRPAFYGICPHWEPIFIYFKGDKPWRPFRGKDIFPDVISANVVYDKDGKKKHPTPKPLLLYEKLSQFACPARGTILDMFAGTGTTLRAAKNLGYHFVGYEKNPEYCAIIVEKLRQQTMEITEATGEKGIVNNIPSK